MNKLQKRCLIASVSAHGSLLLIIAFGSAFVPPKSHPVSDDVLRVIPSRLIDGATGGGGNPNAPKTTEPQIQKGETLELAQPEPPKPEPPKPEPPKPKPPLPKPAVEKETPKPPKDPPKETKESTKEAREPAKEPKEQRKVSLADLKPVKDQPKDTSSSRTSRADNSAMASQIAKLGQDLRAGFKDGNTTDPFGPGGEAYADYSAFVRAVYDNAWIVTDLADNGATTKVEVIIARDGDVVSARIIRSSGSAALDQSVAGVLHKVKHVAPFPAGAREKTRSFIINFNLKNKIGAG